MKKMICEPKENKQIFKNMFVKFAIRTCRMNENKIAEHLLREISRAKRFLLDRWANVTDLFWTQYRRHSLFLLGLEIPCNAKVCFLPASKLICWSESTKQIVERMKLLSAV